MTEPGKQAPKGERERDELDLDKEAIQDLDVTEQEAHLVKGGDAPPPTVHKPPTTT